MASLIYQAFKQNVMEAAFNLSSDTIKVMLVTSSYTPAQTTDTHRSDVTNEVSGTGYTTGGLSLSGLSVTGTGGNGVFTASNVTWSSSTITARAAVLYKSVSGASTDTLICYIDFGSNQTSTSGNFSISWSGSGIIQLS